MLLAGWCALVTRVRPPRDLNVNWLAGWLTLALVLVAAVVIKLSQTTEARKFSSIAVCAEKQQTAQATAPYPNRTGWVDSAASQLYYVGAGCKCVGANNNNNRKKWSSSSIACDVKYILRMGQAVMGRPATLRTGLRRSQFTSSYQYRSVEGRQLGQTNYTEENMLKRRVFAEC